MVLNANGNPKLQKISTEQVIAPVFLKPILKVDENQFKELDARVRQHQNVVGPTNTNCWDAPAAKPSLYAIFNVPGEIVGVVYLHIADVGAGYPALANEPGWWVDPDHQNKRYGCAAITEMAKIISARGAELGRVTIDPGPSAAYSRKLLARLQRLLQSDTLG